MFKKFNNWLQSKFENWNYLLFYKWLTFNVLGFFLFFLAYFQGYVDLVLQNDVSNISFLILGIFLISLILGGWKVFSTSKEINMVKEGRGTGRYHEFKTNIEQSKERRHNAWAEALKLKLFSKILFLKFLASLPVVLGLIGTVVGFILMTSGIGDGVTGAEAARALVTSLVIGMGTALYTTLVGAIFSVWLLANYAFLQIGVIQLIAYILEYEARDIDGEEDA